MKFSPIALALWAAGFCGNAALLSILFARKRAQLVPWFATWVSFNIFYSVVLFGAYNWSAKPTYRVLYWSGAFIDLALQVGAVLEIASYVFRRSGRWVEGARERLMVASVTAGVAGCSMAWLMTPAAPNVWAAWGARVDLGCTVLIAIMFTAIMVVSQQLGVSWRSLVLREGYGLAGWAIFSFITDTLHAYWRTAEHFDYLEDARIFVYIGALAYWAVIFWLPEAITYVPDSARIARAKMAQEALNYRRLE